MHGFGLVDDPSPTLQTIVPQTPPIPPTHTHTHINTHPEPAGGASRILRQASSSPYLARGDTAVDSPSVFAFGLGRGSSGESEGLASEPPSIIGVSTPSLLAAETAVAASAGEGRGYGGQQEDEEEEDEGDVTDETPFLREQRRRNRRRPLPQR